MSKLIILILVILLVASCAPMPEDINATLEFDDKITPVMADKWLNDNPYLALDECHTIMFVNSNDDLEFIKQCVPAGYELYQDVTGNPIAINHTGMVYSFLPHGSSGGIGYTLPPITLTPGNHFVHVIGEWNGWGNPQDYAIRAHYTIDGVPGMVEIGAHPLSANGDYMATFTLDAPELGSYQVSVYLFMVFPPTADSFFTIRSITVEAE